MIWVVGCQGMLGRQLGLALDQAKLPWVGTDRELSILDPQALAEFAAAKQPRWIVNCAAYTAVDKAEDEPALADALNNAGAANLAEAAQAHDAALLHISTDYVFGGDGIADKRGGLRPYLPDDPAAPRSVYGASKAAGEAAVRAVCGRHVILRTAWLYGRHGPNFVYTMLRLMRQRDNLGVVCDQWGNPTWAGDLAQAVVAILRSREQAWGNHHFSGEGIVSWFDFAAEIQRLGRQTGILERDCALKRLTSDQYPAKAKRPAWSALDKESLKTAFDVEVPDWRESLAAFFAEIAPQWRDIAWINPPEVQ